MSFKIYLNENIGNQIANILETSIKKFTVQNLDIQEGFLIKGNYRIPVNHILFIEEV